MRRKWVSAQQHGGIFRPWLSLVPAGEMQLFERSQQCCSGFFTDGPGRELNALLIVCTSNDLYFIYLFIFKYWSCSSP